MTPRIRRLIARIERERRIFENRYLRAARQIARTIRTNSYAAVRLGVDAIDTARASIVGDSQHRGIVPLLADAMLVAYLLGLRRSVLETSGPPADPPPEQDFKTARNWLAAWLGIDLFLLRQLTARFNGAARLAAIDFADNIAAMMRRTGGGGERPPILPGAVAAAGADDFRQHGPALIDVRRSLDARGISADPAHDYAIAGLMTTQILRGYGQGQWAGYSQVATAAVAGQPPRFGGPALVAPAEPTIWAFRHISVLDERTTEICNVADGTTLAADHPYWQTHWPPLHWNCRSVVVPMYEGFIETEVPDVAAMAGFGNPW